MQGLTYNVDLVMCIDCTGSMGAILKTVKANAIKFYNDLTDALETKSKVIDRLRIKVVGFRDLYVDGDASIEMSAFFEIPSDQSSFESFVGDFVADGGGDEPESGLEALALAMKSDWNNEGSKKRHVIIVWTDASAHKLEDERRNEQSGYPTGMPSDFDELADLWMGQEHMSTTAKRLLLFAPDAYPWADIATFWEQTIQYPSKAGKGLERIRLQDHFRCNCK